MPSSELVSAIAVALWVTMTVMGTSGSSVNAASARSATSCRVSPPRRLTSRPASQSAYSSGYLTSTSSLVSPSQCPRPRSRKRGSGIGGNPASSPTISAVCNARPASELTSMPGRSAATSAATAYACARPTSSSGGAAWPWKRRWAFHSVRPWRSRTTVLIRSSRSRLGARGPLGRVCLGGGVGERDERAVPPEALERVEHPLLGVLDVHDDVTVVEQHPAAVALALAADRLAAGLPGPLLDRRDGRLRPAPP